MSCLKSVKDICLSSAPDMTLKQAKIIAASFGVNVNARPWLISKPDANPKLVKGEKLGVLTAPLHGAPAWLSGYNACAGASPGCTDACVHFAGNPIYMPGKERARIAKTKLYFEARAAFLVLLESDLIWLAAKAERLGFICGWRPNATTDIPYERVKIRGVNVIEFAKSLGIVPYDYTAIVKRAINKPYHITFSRKENNDDDCLKVLRGGGNVAVVFGIKRGAPLPATWQGYEVIDGDLSDWRPGDKINVVVGLREKGKAKTDTSGFVVR